jgi:ribose/xylose/arabinose/galactoside ABC-type transport system permease subunit
MKTINWNMWFGFWLGVIVISLVNIGLIILNHNQYLYDWYISGVSIVVLIAITILKNRSKV